MSGYGLVVEHDLAKVETGVRFSLPAQKTCFIESRKEKRTAFAVLFLGRLVTFKP